MSLPVKLSDALVLDARIAGEAQVRSIAGQVEFWARLGRSVDDLLDGRTRNALRENTEEKPLSELIATVGTSEGKARLKAYLDSLPFPHYEPYPSRKGYFVRIEEDGNRCVGRFVNRKFVVDQKDTSKIVATDKEDISRLEQVATWNGVDEAIVEYVRTHLHVDVDLESVRNSLNATVSNAIARHSRGRASSEKAKIA